ncbi:hypothetical protein B0H10DRAFT_1962558 [Mycena sp. CBHHK59/15]|nr:hypothetical protein B0H10DRAFT_1962558 [Mycena sp. CBHHK59/15]
MAELDCIGGVVDPNSLAWPHQMPTSADHSPLPTPNLPTVQHTLTTMDPQQPPVTPTRNHAPVIEQSTPATRGSTSNAQSDVKSNQSDYAPFLEEDVANERRIKRVRPPSGRARFLAKNNGQRISMGKFETFSTVYGGIL